ncbi:MAG: LacI family DNA-binding transcriptional regulator [Eubacteriales bacterium]
MITIYDIAKECGVTAATVSKALNDNSGVSEKRRMQIKKIAKEMGYLPNAQARSLSTKKSKDIGVLFYEDTNYGLAHQFFSKMLESLRHEIESRGYDLSFIATNSTQFKGAYYEHCKYKGIDGAVIASVDFDEEEVVKLVNSEIPVVLIDKIIENKTSIVSKNYEGTKEAIHYLHQCGHEKIGFIRGQSVSNDVTESRMDGFKQGMAECGLAINSAWVKCGRYYKQEATQQLVREILTKKEKPTALLLSDDYAALGAYKAIAELNLKIPEDISIIGNDGLELTEIVTPSLTTIAQDPMEMGRLAGEHIVRLAESNQPKQRVVEVGTKLKIGNSVKIMR